MDPKHPTNKDWVMFDPVEHPPPVGQTLLILNEGGVLITGLWYQGALAWCYKPVVPVSVKSRISEKLKQQREKSDESKSEDRKLDPSGSLQWKMEMCVRLRDPAQRADPQPD